MPFDPLATPFDSSATKAAAPSDASVPGSVEAGKAMDAGMANPPFQPVEMPDLVDVIEGELTRAIVEGSLRPGSRVVEAELARRMGISRAPLREAARRLERQGILISRPRRGFFVRDITVKEIDDLYYVRLSLESSAVALACERIDDAGIDRLQAFLDRLRDDTRTLQPHQRIARDLQFHRMLFEAADNERLLRLFNSVETEVRMVIALLDNVYQDPVAVALSHQPILDALKRRDAGAASAGLQAHVRQGWEHVRTLFTSQIETVPAARLRSDKSPAPATGKDPLR